MLKRDGSFYIGDMVNKFVTGMSCLSCRKRELLNKI